ncbi:MAG: cell division protein ZapA [Clostridia bacterium]|nr:cell division protein ZapA [Clostridia bacterium]
MAKEEMKKCSVRIGGVVYQLVTLENESYTRQIASRADEMINRVLQDNPKLNQTMATVLALVNAVDELTRGYHQIKILEDQKSELEQKALEARHELNRMREQNWEMKKELLRQSELNRDYQALINKLTAAQEPEESVDRNDLPEADDFQGDLSPVDSTANIKESEKPKSNDENEKNKMDEQTSLSESFEGNNQDAMSLDRMQQTNLDDYLHAFGLSDVDHDPIKPGS